MELFALFQFIKSRLPYLKYKQNQLKHQANSTNETNSLSFKIYIIYFLTISHLGRSGGDRRRLALFLRSLRTLRTRNPMASKFVQGEGNQRNERGETARIHTLFFLLILWMFLRLRTISVCFFFDLIRVLLK